MYFFLCCHLVVEKKRADLDSGEQKMFKWEFLVSQNTLDIRHTVQISLLLFNYEWKGFIHASMQLISRSICLFVLKVCLIFYSGYHSVDLTPVAAVSAQLFSGDAELHVNGPVRINLGLPDTCRHQTSSVVPAWYFNRTTGKQWRAIRRTAVAKRAPLRHRGDPEFYTYKFRALKAKHTSLSSVLSYW